MCTASNGIGAGLKKIIHINVNGKYGDSLPIFFNSSFVFVFFLYTNRKGPFGFSFYFPNDLLQIGEALLVRSIENNSIVNFISDYAHES